jgi:hypothetical protein
VTAGGSPVILTRPFGKGKVCSVTTAPLGDAPQGETAFWDWPEWPKLVAKLLASLQE